MMHNGEWPVALAFGQYLHIVQYKIRDVAHNQTAPGIVTLLRNEPRIQPSYEK